MRWRSRWAVTRLLDQMGESTAMTSAKDDPIFYVNKDAPWTNLADLIADAKSRPGEIKIGVVSSKGMDVVYLQDFEKRAGIKLGEAIPMGGGGPLRREVVGGHINLAFHAAWVARKAQGLVRAIGIRSLKPSPIWPEAQLFNDVLPEANRYTEKDITTLPTFIKGFAVSATTRENHPDRVKTLVDSFERAMQSPEWTEMVAKQQLKTALDYHSMAKTSEIVAVQEIRKARRSPSGDREEDEPAPALLRLPPFTDRRWNPFFLVVLTLLFTVSLPHIKSVLAVYLYVCLLRLVFRKATLRTCVLDLVLVVLLYVVFNDLLRILLPAGPVEEAISAVVRSVIRG